MKKTYDQKLENVTNWVKIVNHYWPTLQGEFYNNKEFWDQTFHSMTEEDWWDLCDVMKVLEIQEPELFRKYPYASIRIEDVLKKLHAGKSVVNKHISGKNTVAVGALMNTKDIINEIAGTPTIQFKKPKKKNKLKPPSKRKERPSNNFNSLFDIQ